MKYAFNNRAKAELVILKELLETKSPNNRTINLLDSCTFEDITIMVFPHAGAHIDKFQALSSHLIPLSQQLIEGVLFMHSKNIAHMDIKPWNLLVNPTGKLTIIDFGLSSKFADGDTLWEEFIGTPNWTAPEIGIEPYNPMLADVWACRNIIKTMHAIVTGKEKKEVRPEFSFLEDIFIKLTREDPKSRLSLEEAADRIKCQATVVQG